VPKYSQVQLVNIFFLHLFGFSKTRRRTFQQIGLEHKNALYSAIYISFCALQIKKQDNFDGAFLIFVHVLCLFCQNVFFSYIFQVSYIEHK